MERMRLLTIIAVLAFGISRSYADDKVTFIRDGQVWTARIQGAATEITNDSLEKHTPVWSPDGTKIVYSGPSQGPKAVGALTVIGESGTIIRRCLIATVTPTGVQIDGMRAIDRIGWLDNKRVFAIGNVNPYLNEYRVVNIESCDSQSFGGFEFSTCARRGSVAFWEPVLPQDDSMSLVTLSSKRPLFEFSKPHDLPTLHVPLAWDLECTTLAFVDPRPPVHLVVISVSSRDKKSIELPGAPTSMVQAVENGFLLGPNQDMFYPLGSSGTRPPPASVLQTLKERKKLEKQAEEVLEAVEPNWWP